MMGLGDTVAVQDVPVGQMSSVDTDWWLQRRWAADIDDERLAERIHNALQNMWRAGTSAGLTPSQQVMREIDSAIREWNLW